MLKEVVKYENIIKFLSFCILCEENDDECRLFFYIEVYWYFKGKGLYKILKFLDNFYNFIYIYINYFMIFSDLLRVI